MANVGSGISRVLIDVDGEAVVVNDGRLAVETEQDDAFSSWVNYPDFVAETGTSQALTHANHTNASITNAKEIFIQTDDANDGFVMVGGTQGTTLAGSVGAGIFLIGSASTQYVNVAYFK